MSGMPKGDPAALLLVAGGLLFLGFFVTRGRKLITQDLNPASQENIVYQGFKGDNDTVRGFDKIFIYTDLWFGGPTEKQRARNYLDAMREFE